jgi:hypothetical protein
MTTLLFCLQSRVLFYASLSTSCSPPPRWFVPFCIHGLSCPCPGAISFHQVAQLSPSGSDLPVAHAEVNWGTFAKPVARGHDAGLPAFTLLGADNASELAPYPKLFSGGPPSVPERLLSSFWLHPQPPYPGRLCTPTPTLLSLK